MLIEHHPLLSTRKTKKHLMDKTPKETRPVAVITGFGPGLGFELASCLIEEGYTVAGLSRTGRAPDVAGGHFHAYACDITDADSVRETFQEISWDLGPASALVHNAATLIIGDFLDLTSEVFENSWRTATLGAMLSAQQVLPGMVTAGRGTILFTGATASIRGGADFSAFASAKFALRGLAQSLARRYGPQGIQVVHALIDGIIWGERAKTIFDMDRSNCLEAADLAQSFVRLIGQPRSVWTHEIDFRPAKANF